MTQMYNILCLSVFVFLEAFLTKLPTKFAFGLNTMHASNTSCLHMVSMETRKENISLHFSRMKFTKYARCCMNFQSSETTFL